jgi:hypothetical protein
MSGGTIMSPLGVRSLIRRAISVWAACMAVAAPARAEITQFETPSPITSADLERLARAAGLAPAERAQLDTAFDAYVEGWQRLRQGTLRPLRAEVTALLAERVAAQPAWEAIQVMPQEQQEEAYRVAGEQSARIMQETAARATALQDRAAAAYRAMAQLEEPVFAALRQGERSETQREAVATEAARRARKLAAARIRNASGSGLGVTTPLPSAAEGAPPEAARAIAAFERDSGPAITAIADAISAPGANLADSWQLRQAFAAEQLQAVEAVTTLLPEQDRAAWRRRARGRLLFSTLFMLPAPSQESLLTMMGDRATPAARTRMEAWFQEREKLENALLTQGNDDGTARNTMTELDRAALVELAEMTRTPDLAGQNMGFAGMMDLLDPTNPDDASELFNQPGYMVSMGADLMGQTDEDEEPGAAQDPMAMQRRMMEVPSIDRRTLEGIHDRLGISAERQAVWDNLVDDLLADCQEIAKAHELDMTGMQDPRRGMEAMQKLRDHRAALSAREAQWFQDLRGGIAGLDPGAVATEQSRRDLQRLQRTSGWILMSLRMTGGNRWMDVDLDAAVDGLPAPERALVAKPLAAWREQKTREIGDLVAASDEMVDKMGRLMQKVDGENYPMQDMMKIQTDWMSRCETISRRAEAAQKGDIETMVSALPETGGRGLRRAVRKTLYPEVHRPQERIDRMVESAIALPDLSAEQLTALGAQADAYRIASDAIAERMIAALEAADSARGNMMKSVQASMEDSKGMMARAATMQSTQLASSDLAFDRAELDARTRRRFKALLTPEQAAAAGLD